MKRWEYYDVYDSTQLLQFLRTLEGDGWTVFAVYGITVTGGGITMDANRILAFFEEEEE